VVGLRHIDDTVAANDGVEGILCIGKILRISLATIHAELILMPIAVTTADGSPTKIVAGSETLLIVIGPEHQRVEYGLR
jgi:hypothetical protein